MAGNLSIYNYILSSFACFDLHLSLLRFFFGFGYIARLFVESNFAMFSWIRLLGALLLLASVAQAQFQFFEHMFGGGGGGGGGHQGRQQAAQNVPSDSSRYQSQWDSGKWWILLLGYACKANRHSPLR